MEATCESQLLMRRTGLARVVSALSIAMALAAGLTLRLWLLRALMLVSGDALIYGGLAKNLILHGQYAITDGSGVLHSTLIRLPGYPLFLGFCFRFFGMENYASVAWVQIAIELLGCLLLADFAARIAPVELRLGARHCTLWLAVLCPFTSSYTMAPLTETLTLFSLAFALWATARFCERPAWTTALWFTFAITYAALLRPDGALAGIVLVPVLWIGMQKLSTRRLLCMAAVCVSLALAPFAAWSYRNWQVFHVFQPLAPRYANDPSEDAHLGWQRWVKTWCLDFTSTEQIYWTVPGEPLDLNTLPSRAFDSPAQYTETAKLADDYNDNGQDISAELDARFGKLAEERIHAHPLRYFVWLPLGRVADMWLRPRVENLPIDLDWWNYAHHNVETRFSWAYAGLNLFYLSLGIAGLLLRPRFWGAMLAYFVLRSVLLATIEAPETRYTLECFPMLFALGGIALYWLMTLVLPSVLKVKASPGNF
jgi:hypothetical protein